MGATGDLDNFSLFGILQLHYYVALDSVSHGAIKMHENAAKNEVVKLTILRGAKFFVENFKESRIF